MKVWITKYALTKGIFETEVTSKCLDIDPTGNMICITENGFNSYCHGEGKEWNKDKESAIKRADEMKKKKISSLKKQIEKLKNMKFD